MPLLVLLLAYQLTAADQSWIGQRIWFNECRGSVEGLTTWNVGEEFPSLGIGHFIWYPAGFAGPFHESFPEFVAYAVRQGAEPPAVALAPDAPWSSKAEFDRADKSELRDWLASTVELQTAFIVERSEKAAAGLSERGKQSYARLRATPNGTYALIDYVNFKGEGQEQYRGQGWGLRQVLEEMPADVTPQRAPLEFARAAQRLLDRRIANSPPERGEERWRAGWHKRCETYAWPIQVVTREQWGSRPQPFPAEMRQTPGRLVVHHAGVAIQPGEDPAAKLRRLQAWGQKDKGWQDVPYHFVIAPDGRIFEGRDWRYRPASNTEYDLDGVVNVELDGNFEVETPTEAQKESLVAILAYLCQRHDLDPAAIDGHRDEAPGQTDCPGKNLYPFVRDEVQGRVRARL